MQIQLCLEAAVRAFYEFGFQFIVVQDACATRDVKLVNKTVKAKDVHIAIFLFSSNLSKQAYIP